MKKILIVVLGIIVAMPLFSQQLPLYSLYRENSFMLNPAIAGSADHAIASICYRQEWIKVQEAPRTVLGSYTTPIRKKNIGLGISLSNDQTGPTSYTGLTVAAAYHISFEKINPFRWPEFLRNSKISIGLSGSLYQYRLNSGELLTDIPNDNAINTTAKSTWLPNAGLGIYYYYDKFYTGFSIPNVIPLNESFNDQNTVSNIKQALTYEVVAGGKIPINQGWKNILNIEPLVWFRYEKNAPWQVDGNVRIRYKNLFWVGVGYRSLSNIVADAGVIIKEHIEISYAYDQSVSDLHTYLGSSHEILVAYHFSPGKQHYKRYR